MKKPDVTLDMLTDRERKMLQILAEGRGSVEIGTALDLTVGTVRVYLHNLYAKLGVKNKTQAALWFVARRASG